MLQVFMFPPKPDQDYLTIANFKLTEFVWSAYRKRECHVFITWKSIKKYLF